MAIARVQEILWNTIFVIQMCLGDWVVEYILGVFIIKEGDVYPPRSSSTMDEIIEGFKTGPRGWMAPWKIIYAIPGF